MRYLLLFLIVLGSCKSQKKPLIAKEAKTEQLCPEDGDCTFEILKNKNLVLNYQSLGNFYPMFPEGENIIVKFEYKRNEMSNTQDSSYREEILIQLDPNNLELETTNLKEKKMLFARWCYCKGETGYYKIKYGNLLVKKIKENLYELNLSFKIDEVPQVITKIQHIFSL